MKKIILFLLLHITNVIFAQPTCQWAYIPEGPTQSYNHIYNATSDQNGNIIELGMILGSADMNPGTNPSDTSFTDGGYNYYISKTSSAGQLMWIHYFENNSQIASLEYSGVKVNSANEIVITGNYTGLIDFDLSDSGVDTLRSHFPTYPDYFIAKYDSSGNYKWAFNIGDSTTNSIETQSLTILSNDNIVVVANPIGTLDVDPGSGVHYSIGGNANLICYDSNGNYVWNNNISTSTSYAIPNNSLDHDNAGNMYVASVGYYELTITKIDNGGTQLLNMTLGQFSAGARVNPQSILTDISTGDLYIAGTFGGTVDFDPGAMTVTKTSSSGFFQDGFIAKYDQNLNLQWVNAYQGEMNFGKSSLDFDGTQLIAAGGMKGTIDFGNGNIFSTITNSTGPLFLKLNTTTGNTDEGYLLDGFGQYQTINTCPNNVFATTGIINGVTDFDPTPDTLILTPGTNNSFTAFYSQPVPTNISSNSASQKVFAYPNPATNFIQLKINDELIGSVYSIHDLTGRTIQTGELNKEKSTLQIEDLAKGMYFLSLCENSTQTIRFIKE